MVGGVSVVLGVCFVLLLVTCVPSLLGSSLCGVLPICGAGLVVCLYGVMGWGWSMMVRVRFGCLGWVVCDEGYVGAERCGVWVGGCGSYCGECCAGGYEDYETDNVYRFLTNNLDVDTLTVAELYRERWMVELFFKWVKQHLHIKKFYGTSENAVYLQLWIAVCDYLLLIIAKKRFCLPQTLHTISDSIGPLLFKQDDIHSIFQLDEGD